jgi:hypothetical protein
VDFRLEQDGESVYVPSGGVHVDAPIYVETYVDPGATMQVKLWAIPVGLPMSLCGRVMGSSSQPRVDPLEEWLPAVVTWRRARDYVEQVARRAGQARVWGWALTIAGTLAVIGGMVRA